MKWIKLFENFNNVEQIEATQFFLRLHNIKSSPFTPTEIDQIQKILTLNNLTDGDWEFNEDLVWLNSKGDSSAIHFRFGDWLDEDTKWVKELVKNSYFHLSSRNAPVGMEFFKTDDNLVYVIVYRGWKRSYYLFDLEFDFDDFLKFLDKFTR